MEMQDPFGIVPAGVDPFVFYAGLGTVGAMLILSIIANISRKFARARIPQEMAAKGKA